MPFAMMDEKHPTVLSRELLLTELPRVTECTDISRWPVPGIYVCYLLTYKNCPSITARWTDVQRKDS